MSITETFAGVAVADFPAPRAWYERLLGRPPDMVPHETEVVWKLTEGGWIYVVGDPERAGGSLVTLLVATSTASSPGSPSAGSKPARSRRSRGRRAGRTSPTRRGTGSRSASRSVRRTDPAGIGSACDTPGGRRPPSEARPGHRRVLAGQGVAIDTLDATPGLGSGLASRA